MYYLSWSRIITVGKSLSYEETTKRSRRDEDILNWDLFESEIKVTMETKYKVQVRLIKKMI